MNKDNTERLTRRNPDGSADFANCDFEAICYDLSVSECATVRAALEKLAALEDMQEQRRLVELPCPLGERVYEVKGKEWKRDCRDKLFSYFPRCQHPFWENNGKDCPCAERTWPVHCKACEYYRAGAERYCECPYEKDAEFNIRAKLFEYTDIPNVGKTVFLTAKEAEAALKEREARQ